MCPLCDDTGWKPVDVNGTRRVERCDCWREGVGEVDASAILEVMRANLATARSALRHLAKALPAEREASPIDTALDTAVVTPFESWSAEAKVRLGAVAGRYMQLAASPAPVG